MKSAQLEPGLRADGEEPASTGSFVQSFPPPSISMLTAPERSSSVETSECQEIAPGTGGRGGVKSETHAPGAGGRGGVKGVPV